MIEPTAIVLIRHGVFDGLGERLEGRSRIGLSEAGRRQAREAAERCRALGLAGIWCSPRRRAVETAAIIARLLGLRIELDAAFDEVDYGRWTGQSLAGLAQDAAWRLFNERRDVARIPGGESLRALSARVIHGLDAMRSRTMTAPAAVVTHAEVVRAAVLAASGQSWKQWADYQPPPGSLSLLVWDGAWTSRGVGLEARTIAAELAAMRHPGSPRRLISTHTA